MNPERLKEIRGIYLNDWDVLKALSREYVGELLDYVAELEASNAAMFQGRILATERELRLQKTLETKQTKIDALEARDTLEAKKVWRDLCRIYGEQLHTTR